MNGLVQWWKEPVPGVRYIAGADCADEGGEGVNYLIIQNAQTGEDVLQVWGDIPADSFAELCDKYCRWFNNALLAPERNGVGNTVISVLKTLEYPNLYKENGKEGWYTNAYNRFHMLDEYRLAVDRNQVVIYDRRVIDEHRTFVLGSGGKFKHIHSARDDSVMGHAICWQMRNVRQGVRAHLRCWKRRATTYA
jgi:hypothetical protein